jgi:DNA-binding Lrp family transcriptional regulator
MEQEEPEEGFEKPTDVYHLFPQVPAKWVDHYKSGSGPAEVRYAARVAGDYMGLLVVELPKTTVDEPNGLVGLASQDATVLADAENPGNSVDPVTVTPVKYGPLVLKQSVWFPVSAFVQIRTEKGMADAVLESTSRLPGYSGSAIVLGPFNILLDVGAEEWAALTDVIINQIPALPGVKDSRPLNVSQQWHRDEDSP